MFCGEEGTEELTSGARARNHRLTQRCPDNSPSGVDLVPGKPPIHEFANDREQETNDLDGDSRLWGGIGTVILAPVSAILNVGNLAHRH